MPQNSEKKRGGQDKGGKERPPMMMETDGDN